MTRVISQRALRDDSSRMMRESCDAQTFILTRHDEPVGEPRPLRRRRIANLLITATALAGRLPLCTRNPDNSTGLEHLIDIVPM